MDTGKNSEDNTERKKDGGSEEDDKEGREGDKLSESKTEEELQTANNVYEIDEDGSQKLSHTAEIVKSRRSRVDEKSTTCIHSILEGKRSHRLLDDYDDSNTEQKSIQSIQDKKEEYSRPTNNDMDQRPSSTSTLDYEQELFQPDSEDPVPKDFKMEDDRVNLIGDKKKSFQNTMDQETENLKEERYVPPVNADVNEKTKPNSESDGETFVASNPGALNKSLDVNSFKGERESFKDSHYEQKSVVNRETENHALGEQLSDDSHERHKKVPAMERGGNQNPSSFSSISKSHNSSYSDYFGENSSSDPSNSYWKFRKLEQKISEKEIFVNPYEQRESLPSSRSFLSQPSIKDEKESAKPYKDRGSNTGQSFRGSGVRFKEYSLPSEENANGNTTLLKGSDNSTPVKSPSPQKITIAEVALQPNNEDSGENTISTTSTPDKNEESGKNAISTTSTPVNNEDSGKSTISTTSTPDKKKKEVIKIDKELATIVILLLKKIEKYQNNSPSPSENKPSDVVARELESERFLENFPIHQTPKNSRDSNRDIPGGSNFEKRESPSRWNSIGNSKVLSDEIQPTYRSESTPPPKRYMEETEGADDKVFVIKNVSNRATSTSTLEGFSSSSNQRTSNSTPEGFCSSSNQRTCNSTPEDLCSSSNKRTRISTPEGFCSCSKCQRTCKRCSEMNGNIKKRNSANSRGEDGRHTDASIVPALEAIAGKLKDSLKIGCSLLKDFYYNQHLLRVFYFKTEPGDAETTEEFE